MGTTTLEVGDDKFQCLRIDGVDFLVVASADDGKEVARVPCKPEDLMVRSAVRVLIARQLTVKETPHGPPGRAALSL